MMRLTHGICASAALLTLTTLTTTAYADGRDWNDGPVLNVAAIRTAEGHFDDYMHWLATGWKKQEEAAKAAGLITRYQAIVVEARNPHTTRTSTWSVSTRTGPHLITSGGRPGEREGGGVPRESLTGRCGAQQDPHRAGIPDDAGRRAEVSAAGGRLL